MKNPRSHHQLFLPTLVALLPLLSWDTSWATAQDTAAAANRPFQNDSYNDTLHYCSFLLLTAFSAKEDDEQDSNFTYTGASYSASTLLAMQDLQRRQSSIVPDLQERMEACPQLQFLPTDLIVLDSQDEDMVGLQALLQTLQDYDQHAPSNLDICGLVGPWDGKGIEKTIGVTEFRGISQMIISGGDVDDYAGEDGQTAVANFFIATNYFDLMASYVANVLGISHMSYISDKSKRGRLNHDIFQEAMDEWNITHHAVFFEEEKHKKLDGVRQDLISVKEAGIRTMFLAPDYRKPFALIKIAKVMDELHMLDGDFQYFLFEESIRPDDIDFLFGEELKDPESPLRKLLQGAAWMSEIDPFALKRQQDPFATAWKQVDMGLLFWPESATPVGAWPDNALPARHSSFVYDSVLAMGLAKCQEKRSQERLLKDKEEKDLPDPKTEQIGQLLEMEPFEGASGTVDFVMNDKKERYRVFEGISVAMFNFRVVEEEAAGTGVVVETPLSYLWSQDESEWQPTGAGFVFANGETERSYPEYVVAEENFLSDTAFYTGMALFAIGLTAGLFFLGAVTYLEDMGPIKMAQPRFLQLICLGSLMQTFAVLTLSFDESRGWDQAGLDAACMATAWLFFLGHATIYSATFCKLWRIDLVMQASKRRVTYLQAMWPCGVVLLVTLLILILWTAMDPWRWEREFVTIVPPETLGKCTSDNFAGYFWALTSILMFCTFCTLIMAWKTQTISQNLSDASTVFYLILTQLQAWFVGIPILAAIGDDSVDTVYLGRVLLIWMFAMAPLFIVLLPRVAQAINQILHPELIRNGGTVKVSGIEPHQSTTASMAVLSNLFPSSLPSRALTTDAAAPSHPFVAHENVQDGFATPRTTIPRPLRLDAEQSTVSFE